MSELLAQLELVNNYLDGGAQRMVCEEDVTYYDVRMFVSLIYRETNDKGLKEMLLELLKVLAKLEIREKPLPTIKKLKSVSPKIFG